MHDLHDDGAAPIVYDVGYLPPASNLLGGLYARLPKPGARRQVGKDPLRDDQTHRGTLRVVLSDQVTRDTFHTGAEPGHGRHDEPVAQLVRSEVEGGIKFHVNILTLVR